MCMELIIPALGLFFVIGGGALSAYHLHYLFTHEGESNTSVAYRIGMTVTGAVFMSIGANLFASTLHDRFKGE